MKQSHEPQQRLYIDAYDYVEIDFESLREWDMLNRWKNVKRVEKQIGKQVDIKASSRHTNNTKLA